MAQKLVKLKSKSFVEKWAAKLTPITIDDRHYKKLLLGTTDHFGQSFTWSTKIGEKICSVNDILDSEPGLVTTGVVATLHTWGYYGFFKPSIAEIISQTPLRILKESKYFRLVGPENCDDMNKFYDVLNDGYHVGITTFYKDKIVQKVPSPT